MTTAIANSFENGIDVSDHQNPNRPIKHQLEEQSKLLHPLRHSPGVPEKPDDLKSQDDQDEC